MLFSAGAYAGGLALDETGAAAVGGRQGLRGARPRPGMNFWVVYVAVIAIMTVSRTTRLHDEDDADDHHDPVRHRGSRRQLGFNPVALALPAAFTIDWVIGLPISAQAERHPLHHRAVLRARQPQVRRS